MGRMGCGLLLPNHMECYLSVSPTDNPGRGKRWRETRGLEAQTEAVFPSTYFMCIIKYRIRNGSWIWQRLKKTKCPTTFRCWLEVFSTLHIHFWALFLSTECAQPAACPDHPTPTVCIAEFVTTCIFLCRFAQNLLKICGNFGWKPDLERDTPQETESGRFSCC